MIDLINFKFRRHNAVESYNDKDLWLINSSKMEKITFKCNFLPHPTKRYNCFEWKMVLLAPGLVYNTKITIWNAITNYACSTAAFSYFINNLVDNAISTIQCTISTCWNNSLFHSQFLLFIHTRRHNDNVKFHSRTQAA